MAHARLRSVLYVPGAAERALEKAASLPADALILDLEDSVLPASKPAARARISELVGTGYYGSRPLAIRINAAGTPWHADDLRAAVDAAAAAILLPKVSSSRDVVAVERQLDVLGAPPALKLWAMLETPAAVLATAAIASCSKRLSVLVVGTNDLRRELGARSSPERMELLTSLSLCVLGARTGGAQLLDGVFNHTGDLEGFEAECDQARRLGFDGKTLVHPAQIEPCNRAFSPSQADVDEARRVISAFEAAARAGTGVATVDGVMIEALHVVEAKRILARTADA